MDLDSKVPGGPLEEKWDRHCFELKLVNPANKRKFEIIVVGTGLAGASASATLADLGYRVKTFCIQDSPRRAHSIAAQGGINAAKNYPGDGDSIRRLFYDTIKGGDFRAREANVYRLAQISNGIIDQCVAQGVPFAREYGGLLANRSFGGAQVSRTFYARGQTGQQLLLGAYSALCRQIGRGQVTMFPRTEMLDVVLIEGHAKGIVAVGTKATGIFALGIFLARGVFSLGILSFGLGSVGVVAIAGGAVSVLGFGGASVSVFAFGYLAIGILAVGYHSVGILALGNKAVGIIAIGQSVKTLFPF